MSVTTSAIPDVRLGLSTAIDLAVDTIERIAPEQFHLATPCTEYDVATLVGHLAGAIRRLSGIAADLPFGDLDERIDLAAPLGPQVRAAGDAAIAAWATVDLASERRVPWATLSAASMLEMYVMEIVTHTWDLSIATGQSRTWDPAFGELVLASAVQLMSASPERGDDVPFDAPQPVADDADPYMKLAAFLGRVV